MKILDEIIKVKKAEVRRLKKSAAALPLVRRQTPVLDFQRALITNRPAVIAEIKFRSPSRGLIRKRQDPAMLAKGYERQGAAAVSVLTDEIFFGGRLADLNQIKQAVAIPVLRKDFIIDPVQVDQAHAWGADAILLIKALLDHRQLIHLLQHSRSLGLACLVEVHDEDELRDVLDTPAEIIGINNRCLTDMKVDLRTSLNLIRMIPQRCLAVSESGIKTPADIRQLAAAGFDALLVGSVLMASSKPADRLRQLVRTSCLTRREPPDAH